MAMKTSYLLILFVAIAILLLTMLPHREGFRAIKTPPLSAEESMKQVNKGTKELGSDGYMKSLNARVASLEQTYPDIPEEE